PRGGRGGGSAGGRVGILAILDRAPFHAAVEADTVAPAGEQQIVRPAVLQILVNEEAAGENVAGIIGDLADGAKSLDPHLLDARGIRDMKHLAGSRDLFDGIAGRDVHGYLVAVHGSDLTLEK